MAKKISIGDIANALNISKTTVSFIINGKAGEKRISKELTDRVEQYIKQTAYKPNQLAQSLSTGKTMTIGLMVEKISDYFFAQIAYHIEELAYQSGYKILYCSTDNDLEKAKELIQLFKDRHVDGYIITPPAGLEGEIQQLVNDGLPVVLFDRFFKNVNTSYVVLDNFEASHHAADFLAKNNFKNIALVELESDQIQMSDRKSGYKAALKRHGLKPMVKRIAYTNDDQQTVAILLDFIKKNRKIDALFFATNYLAFSGIKALNTLGLKIPSDMAIVAFDDHQVFDVYEPTVTAVAQPIEELARQSIGVLLNMLNKDTPTPFIQKVIVKAKLIIRASTPLNVHNIE